MPSLMELSLLFLTKVIFESRYELSSQMINILTSFTLYMFGLRLVRRKTSSSTCSVASNSR